MTVLTVSGFAYAAPGGDGPVVVPARSMAPPDAETEFLSRSLRDLDSPYLATRTAAIASLSAAGAKSRPALRDAFRQAGEPRRAQLARVLASGADRDDLSLLLDALAVAKDPQTIATLRDVLVEHAEESEAVIASRRTDGAAPTAWSELEGLLERARLEALFVSRKSLSGGTGSYDGQYEVLRPWRKPALEICVAMLAETEVRRPGVFPAGTYRFLRPPPVLVEHEELREMAANAIAELCTADDTAILTRLEAVHEALEADMARTDDANRVKRLIAASLDDIVLPTLVALDRRSRMELELRVRAYEEEREFYDEAARLRLRMKEFPAAVELFQRQISNGQYVIPSYNLACAYARWSETTAGDDAKLAARLRDLAVRALADSVTHGYADWAWMEQDLDLRAIRDTTGYRELVADLKKRFPPPSTWRRANSGTGGPGRAPGVPTPAMGEPPAPPPPTPTPEMPTVPK